MLGIVEFHQFGMNEVFPQIFLDSISLYSPNSIIFATFNKVQNRLLLMTGNGCLSQYLMTAKHVHKKPLPKLAVFMASFDI